MKETFKQIPRTMSKPLSPKQRVQKLMTEIGGGWYMGKIAKGLQTLRRPRLSKKVQASRMKFKTRYMEIISGEMIENSNYIGTSLNG